MARGWRSICSEPRSRTLSLSSIFMGSLLRRTADGGCGDRLGLGEGPVPAEDLGTRAVGTHEIVPAGRGRQAVRNLAVAAAELYGDRAVGVLLRREVIQRVG